PAVMCRACPVPTTPSTRAGMAPPTPPRPPALLIEPPSPRHAGPPSLPGVLDIPGPYRTFQPGQPAGGSYGPGTFTIDYLPSLAAPDATYSNDVLDYTWKPRLVAAQPGLPGAWDTPFIYEDPRNVFYVTTTEKHALFHTSP